MLKKILAIYLVFLSAASIQSCQSIGRFFDFGLPADVKYYAYDNYCSAYDLMVNGAKKDVVYILDEYHGLPVTAIGKADATAVQYADFSSNNASKIYFPWSINTLFGAGCSYSSELDYIICASNQVIPTRIDQFKYSDAYYYTNFMFVVSNTSYQKIISDGKISYMKVTDEIVNICTPANIAYFFNYKDNPNEGYFFVDLLGSTGKLTKPPYNPKREGYEFSGWYTDAECTDKWDFDNDVVTIEFDEEGNRIYEEFCLYAKWTKK